MFSKYIKLLYLQYAWCLLNRKNCISLHFFEAIKGINHVSNKFFWLIWGTFIVQNVVTYDVAFTLVSISSMWSQYLRARHSYLTRVLTFIMYLLSLAFVVWNVVITRKEPVSCLKNSVFDRWAPNIMAMGWDSVRVLIHPSSFHFVECEVLASSQGN